MISLTKLAIALAASPALFSQLVSAQTWSDCNPMMTSCPDDPALSGIYSHTFGKAAPSFEYIGSQDMIKYTNDGAAFRVEKSLDAPTIVSNFYIMWGKFEVTMKAAPGAGIVSSIVLQSDTLDEIDWEWLGGKTNEAQSNYFGKGNTQTYDRGAFHTVNNQEFHTYGLDWTAERLNWLIDGVVVRTLTPAQVKGDYYPQTPMQARLGSWSGGDSKNEKGVIDWSGGPTDYSKGPFDMIVKKIYIQDYSSGKVYHYKDKTGSQNSIEAVGGQVAAGPQSTDKTNEGYKSSKTGSDSSLPSGASNFASYKAPSNSGRVVSETSTSEPTQDPGSGNTPTNVPEATPTSSSSPLQPAQSAGLPDSFATLPTGAGFIVTGGSGSTGTGSVPQPSNGTAPTATGTPPLRVESDSGARKMTGTAATITVVSMAGLVVGWLL